MVVQIGPGSQHCKKCGLAYPSDRLRCYHCYDMDKDEARAYGKAYVKFVRGSNVKIADLFFKSAIWLVAGFIISWLVFIGL